MKRIFILLTIACIITGKMFAQPVYTLANYASANDTFYYTKCQPSVFSFDSSGAGITWNYAGLTGASQRRLIYRSPSQTGYSTLQWPYIFNSNNVNLSSTDGQTISFFGLQQTNPNDYYLKSNNLLRQKASSYTLVINNSMLNVRNVYDNPDTLYKFPLQYNSINSSHAEYSITIPDLYYRNTRLIRSDTIRGWGTVSTPYKTYTNALQHISWVMQVDTLSITGQPLLTNDTSYYKIISWFDPSEKNPVLIVRQNKTGNQYINSSIEYLDVQQYYQPVAAFAFLPVAPNMGDTVNFQNLSTNALAYKWYFGDGPDSSTAINPQHIYTTAGTYPVALIAYNGPLTDTLVVNITIKPVHQTYTFTGTGNWTDTLNWYNQLVPPTTLPATNSIVINHAPGGQCILNVAQIVQSGASFTVNAGMHLVIQGALKID